MTKQYRYTFKSKIKKALKFIVAACLLWFIAHVVYITADGLSDSGKNADAAVILGNKVNKNGTLSQRLQKRLECGMNLYKSGRVRLLIVSGGLGMEGHYEGSKMKEFLLSEGITEEAIIVDDYGANTLATAKNAAKIKETAGIDSVIVVSQYFHITRTKMLFRKCGFKNVYGVSPKYFEIRDFYSILREFAGYYAYLIKKDN